LQAGAALRPGAKLLLTTLSTHPDMKADK